MSLPTSRLRTFVRNWRVKVAIQNLLGLFPGNVGFRINEFFTQLVRGNSIEERQDLKARYLKGIDNLEIVQSRIEEFSLKDKTILEIGTGWHGVDLVIFYLLGAKKIVTVDHYPHLTLANMVSTIKCLSSNMVILDRLRGLGLLSDRVALVEKSITQATSLKDLFDLLAIDCQIVPSKEYKHLTFERQSIDFFYSESVLQRISIKHLQDLLRVVSGYMSNDALIFHRTDQKDINAQEHVDTDLHSLNYLRYSEWFFNFFISGKYNSQNRLRESDFLQFLNESGMSPVYVESYCSKVDIEKLRGFKVARRFKGKTIEDLAVKNSKIVCKKNLLRESADLKRKVVYT